MRKRSKKTGLPPGTPIYTGEQNFAHPKITRCIFSEHHFQEKTAQTIAAVLSKDKVEGTIWIHVEGLHQVAIVEQLASTYGIHPLTLEDILNVDQRPKVEVFEHYVFITLKMLVWSKQFKTVLSEQVSFILGKDFVLSFQEDKNTNFQAIRKRLRSLSSQGLQKKGSDYLAYRLMDSIVDNYFVVLEQVGDQIERLEESIISDPKTENTRVIYQLKHQLMMLRKAIWPMREAISHLSQVETVFISTYTRTYFRDLYDHIVQTIDTIETFREILASMLDVYLSSLTNRMNETMKTLTIIATIFIPITFIASLYGMNFVNMPELRWRYGYHFTLGVMTIAVLIMLKYFRKKKWL